MTGSGESVLVTERSACVSTVVVAVAESFPGVGSVVVVVADAVFVIVDPSSTLALTLTTSVNVAVAPAASVAMLPLNVPVPPTGGLVRVNAGPLVCVADTNVVLAGIASLSATFCASLAPLLVTVIV